MQNMNGGRHLPPLPINASNQQLTLSNQGKVYYKELTTAGSYASENEDNSHVATWSVQTPRKFPLQEGDDVNIVNDDKGLNDDLV